MSDHTKLFERAGARYEVPDLPMEDLLKRHDRKRRNQRIAAGVVGIAVFVAAGWILTSVASLDRGEKSVAPAGGGTGPETTNPAPKSAVGPVPETDYLLDLNTGQTPPLPESIAGNGGYAASPDGSRLAYTGGGDDGKSQMFVANLEGTGIEQMTHDLDGAHSSVWSPDGSKIAYVGYHDGDLRDVFVVDLATGTSTQLTFGTSELDPAAPDLSPWRVDDSVSFTPDGSSIVYSVSRGDNLDKGEVEVRMVPVAGGESELLFRSQSDDNGVPTIDSPRLSPDGSLLSYGCPLGSFCAANIDGTDERVLVHSQGDALGGGTWSPDGTRFAYAAFHQYDVSIMDVATGQATYVAEGWGPIWLDDDTLIVEIPHCYNPATGGLEHGGAIPGCNKG